MSIVSYADKCTDVSSWAAIVSCFQPEGSKQAHLEGCEDEQTLKSLNEIPYFFPQLSIYSVHSTYFCFFFLIKKNLG